MTPYGPFCPPIVESTWTQGRVLRLLGDGEVCSDHLGLLADPRRTPTQPRASPRVARDPNWDLLDFSAIDEDDALTQRLHRGIGRVRLRDQPHADRSLLGDRLARRLGTSFSRCNRNRTASSFDSSSDACWSRTASEWRLVDNARTVRRRVEDADRPAPTPPAKLGEPGCFASPTWAAFHRDVARQLLAEGRCGSRRCNSTAPPIAAEYHLAGARTTFAYQGGVDPTGCRRTGPAVDDSCDPARDSRRSRPVRLAPRRRTVQSPLASRPTRACLLAAAPNRHWPRLASRRLTAAPGVSRHATRQRHGNV